MVKRIDDVGRVAIPKDLRQSCPYSAQMLNSGRKITEPLSAQILKRPLT